MRQVNRDELLWNAKLALRRAPLHLRKGLGSAVERERLFSETLLALLVVRQFGNYEILSSAPLPDAQGDALFEKAATRYLPSDEMIAAILGETDE